MKRVWAFVLAVAMILTMTPAVFAADTPTVTMTADKETVKPGETITLTLVIDQEISNLNDFQFNVEFDGDLFTKKDQSIGDAYTGTQVGNQGTTDEGKAYVPVSGIDTNGDPFALNAGTIVAITFTANDSISTDTTAAFSLSFVSAKDYDTLTNNAVNMSSVVSVSIAVEDTSTTSGYTASISTTATEFTVNDTVAVTVNVGGTIGSFASSEVTLTYDSTYLTFNQDTSTLNDAGVDITTAGTIKLIDHGETQQNGVAYVLNFTAKAATTTATAVTLTDAKFSTAENAISSDLIEATGENALNLTIKNADLNVTLPESGVVTGDVTVSYGGDYTFAAKNNTTYMYYDYEVSATMAGTAVPADNIVNNNNGTWTISNVTGDLVITVTETPKAYNVTVNGDDTVTADEIAKVTTSAVDGKATYNTALTYTLPAGQAATDSVDGYHYTATVTVGNTSYTASANELTYTIAGTAVTGDIVITLSKEVDAAGSVKVTIKDSNEIQKDGVTVTEFTAEKNSEVTLTLVREAGYTYVINDGTNNLTINDDNTFTVNVGTTAVTLTVTKTLNTSSVEVEQYIQLNNTIMWLVTINGNGTTEISGKTYSYDGQNMFWSSKYQAYCYLVVTENLEIETAKAAIGETLVEADAVDVEYNMDVNNTNGKVDANDAQLVYNMYQTKAYDGFSTVDMIKFLEADLNNIVGVDSTDAQVIINNLLNITT